MLDIPLFSAATPDQVRRAQSLGEFVDVPHTTVLMEAGEEDASLAYVVAGQLAEAAGVRTVFHFNPGAVAGGDQVWGDPHRRDEVWATRHTRLWVLTRRAYDQLVAEDNPVAWALERAALTTLFSELREMDQRIAVFSDKAGESDLPELSETLRERLRRRLGARQAVGDGLDASELLARSGAFRGVSEAVLQELTASAKGRRFGADTVIISQGGGPDDVHFLVSGRVDSYLAGQSGGIEWAGGVPGGSVFGVIAAVEGRAHSASCVASTAVEVLAFPPQVWSAMTERSDRVGSAARVAAIRSIGLLLRRADSRADDLEQSMRDEISGSFSMNEPLDRATSGSFLHAPPKSEG